MRQFHLTAAQRASDLLVNNMSTPFETLWVDKYRPRTLSELILTPDNQLAFEAFKTAKAIPHALFLGPPGIGKTSAAKIIASELLQCQYIYINASDENGIDTIRTKVTNFAKTKSLDGKTKVIILDEFDSMTADGQRALRNTMEQYSDITRIIFTGNYKFRILDAILSRCQDFDLTPPLGKVVSLIFNILKQEGITLQESQHTLFLNVIKTHYPDIRRCLNVVQKCCASGALVLRPETSGKLVEAVYNFIKLKQVTELRKHLIASEQQFNGDYVNLLRGMFYHVDTTENNEDVKKVALLVIAEYLYRSTFVIDQEINAYACFIQLTK